jgi:hypothetical protein
VGKKLLDIKLFRNKAKVEEYVNSEHNNHQQHLLFKLENPKLAGQNPDELSRKIVVPDLSYPTTKLLQWIGTINSLKFMYPLDLVFQDDFARTAQENLFFNTWHQYIFVIAFTIGIITKFYLCIQDWGSNAPNTYGIFSFLIVIAYVVMFPFINNIWSLIFSWSFMMNTAKSEDDKRQFDRQQAMFRMNVVFTWCGEVNVDSLEMTSRLVEGKKEFLDAIDNDEDEQTPKPFDIENFLNESNIIRFSARIVHIFIAMLSAIVLLTSIWICFWKPPVKRIPHQFMKMKDYSLASQNFTVWLM